MSRIAKRITKRTRDQAALICAIAASNSDEWFSSIEIGLGWRHYRDAHDLAVRAWSKAADEAVARGESQFTPAVDAEAEALLRTGWSP